MPRFDLLAWLDRHRAQPLTLISAPAGYGKTALVSHWIDTLDRPTAWLSLDEQDDDLAVFLTYVTAAIRTLFPAACRDTLTLLNARSLPPLAVPWCAGSATTSMPWRTTSPWCSTTIMSSTTWPFTT